MNLSSFFEHWKITENPFRGEEARHDPVFLRIGAGGAGGAGGSSNGQSSHAPQARIAEAGDAGAPESGPAARTNGVPRRSVHSDFEKIVGDLNRPSAAIVFGEKGSGKTAIRIQLAERLAAHNSANPGSRCLLVPYDDLNPILDRFVDRVADTGRKRNVTDALGKFRLVDHIDAILAMVVPRIVDTLLNEPVDPDLLNLGPEPRKSARKMDLSQRRDLLLLQAAYDRAGEAPQRTTRLRRLLRLGLPRQVRIWSALAFGGWVIPLAAAVIVYLESGFDWGTAAQILVGALTALWLLALLKWFGFDRIAQLTLGRRLRRQIRISPRNDMSYGRSLQQLEMTQSDAAGVSVLPLTDSDEPRYAMLDRLRRVMRSFGYVSMLIVVDRVDEPTLVSGDPDRMRNVVWPLLNNKFLAQQGIGVKLLLPIELRHALFRESAAFFQEARLDKQNLIERLNWTGAMLYDLCNARLTACRESGSEPIAVLDLFAEDVTRQDIVDALDQMHQPRDAFKLLYQCLSEHCSNVTEDQAQWRIPRLVLETVRKEQAERVRQLYRGVRPA
jgi:hypothetical protein